MTIRFGSKQTKSSTSGLLYCHLKPGDTFVFDDGTLHADIIRLVTDDNSYVELKSGLIMDAFDEITFTRPVKCVEIFAEWHIVE